MPLFVKVRSFLRNLFLSRRVEVDLDNEVRSHLELMTEEKVRAGMGCEEARRAARMELGGVEQVKEQVRDERTGNGCSQLLLIAGSVFDNCARIRVLAWWLLFAFTG
jgi:hypothetical protein